MSKIEKRVNFSCFFELFVDKKDPKKAQNITKEKQEETMNEIVFKEESYHIQGAIFEVYRQMGCGFLEAVYQECLHREFLSRQIPFDPQKPLKLFYKGQQLEKTYVPDFVCYEKIIVELKALNCITGEHRAQVLNYLKATGFRLALLVNFGTHPKAIVERIVL